MKKGILAVGLILGIALAASVFIHQVKVVRASHNSSKDNTYIAHSDDAEKLYIGKNKAREIAIKHAGMKDEEYTITELELDKDHDSIIYEVEFFTTDKEYDYDIDAITGEIVSYDYDIEGFTHPSAEIKENYIGQVEAEQIALSHAQLTRDQIKDMKNELDHENSRWAYEIEFKSANKEYEYKINAYTGEIIDYSIESD